LVSVEEDGVVGGAVPQHGRIVRRNSSRRPQSTVCLCKAVATTWNLLVLVARRTGVR